MEAHRVKDLATNAPKLSQKLAMHKLETVKGSNMRKWLIVFSLAPILLIADGNGGFFKLGMTRTPMSEEYKVRPDYLTNSLFIAHRQDVPSYKHF